MSPVTRPRALCVTAFAAHAISTVLLLWQIPDSTVASPFWLALIFTIVSPFWLALVFTLASLVCAFALSWTARFLLPISLLFQLSLAGAGYFLKVPVAVALSLLGFFFSLDILVLIFTSPAKQLFDRHRPNPDAPVL